MPMHRFLVPLLAIAALTTAACDKDKADDKQATDVAAKVDKKADDPVQQPAAKPEAKPEAKPVLALGAAKIFPKGQPDKAVTLGPDGTVKLAEAKDGWKLTTDGKLSKADGTVVAQVGADGALMISGKKSGIVLNDKGLTLSSPDGKTVTMQFGDDGVVQMVPPPGPGMQMVSEGCKPPVAKSCAMVLSLYLLAADGSSSDASAAEAPPAETAETK